MLTISTLITLNWRTVAHRMVVAPLGNVVNSVRNVWMTGVYNSSQHCVFWPGFFTLGEKYSSSLKGLQICISARPWWSISLTASLVLGWNPSLVTEPALTQGPHAWVHALSWDRHDQASSFATRYILSRPVWNLSLLISASASTWESYWNFRNPFLMFYFLWCFTSQKWGQRVTGECGCGNDLFGPIY